MGSLTDCPWLFQQLSGHLGLQAFQALGRLPRPATSEADSQKTTQKNADSPEPATKSADSKKPAKTAPTKTTPT